MTLYAGKRSGVSVTRQENAERPASALPLRLDLAEHSSTGFEWGYGGPAQLAVALLADVLGDEARALVLCHAFKWDLVTALPEAHWQLSDRDIAEAARQLAAATQEAWS